MRELQQAISAQPAQDGEGVRIHRLAGTEPLAEALEYEQTVFQEVVASDEARAGIRSTQARYDE